jgi:hypothetical protein
LASHNGGPEIPQFASQATCERPSSSLKLAQLCSLLEAELIDAKLAQKF